MRLWHGASKTLGPEHSIVVDACRCSKSTHLAIGSLCFHVWNLLSEHTGQQKIFKTSVIKRTMAACFQHIAKLVWCWLPPIWNILLLHNTRYKPGTKQVNWQDLPVKSGRTFRAKVDPSAKLARRLPPFSVHAWPGTTCQLTPNNVSPKWDVSVYVQSSAVTRRYMETLWGCFNPTTICDAFVCSRLYRLRVIPRVLFNELPKTGR